MASRWLRHDSGRDGILGGSLGVVVSRAWVKELLDETLSGYITDPRGRHFGYQVQRADIGRTLDIDAG